MGPEEVSARQHGLGQQHEERRGSDGDGTMLRRVHPEGGADGPARQQGPRGPRRVDQGRRSGGQAQEPHRRAAVDGADRPRAGLQHRPGPRADQDRPLVPVQAEDDQHDEDGGEGARQLGEACRPGDPRHEGRRVLGLADRGLHRQHRDAGATKADGPRHRPLRQADRHPGRGVPRRHELPLHDVHGLGERHRTRGRAEVRHGPRMRRVLHWKQRRVRLERRVVRTGAPEARLRRDCRQLQPGDGEHRL
mmetsp:Transcript_9613/g.36020  ORF Transcript_9613/g.36020 Transcript_9613/m.36020 type:complete len:249 (-) Transcript_9613:1589-2335(-)